MHSASCSENPLFLGQWALCDVWVCIWVSRSVGPGVSKCGLSAPLLATELVECRADGGEGGEAHCGGL